ncbi:MAG TPA: kelch repeat-containing protein, partial [Myxococcaceae bacterium]
MLLGLLSLSNLGCPKTTPPPSASEPQGTSLLLQVVDAQDNPVPEAVISSRNALFSVDSSGHRLFENLSPGRFFARVDARGFAPATSVLELQAGAHVGTQVRLLPLSAPIPFQAEQGGLLQTEQVRLSIPPNAVVDALGQPVTGPVEATIAPLDPTSQLTSAPGPLEGLTSAEGEAVMLESIFMADVSLWRNGAPLQLAPGKSATLEFLIPEPLARPYKAGDPMPAWWFDLDEGLWREEGIGTFQPSQTHPGRLAWAAPVNHFTYWNVDKPIRRAVLSCVNVRVVDSSGNPVANIPVSALAWEGRETTWADTMRFTGANGQACVTTKQGFSTDILVGLLEAPLVRTTVATANRGGCGGSPSQCLDVSLTLPALICTAGAYEPCAYSGPAGTEDVGRCQASRKWCNVTGTAWTTCQGEVLPMPEDCGTPFDDDCDGEVNEDADCRCPGEGTPCYGGPAATAGVGICHGGTVACDPLGAMRCMGQQLPRAERCWTPEDDDCDGVVTACHSGQWTARDPLASVRSFHTATLLRDGKVLVAGGTDESLGPRATTEVYDPATGTWSATGSLRASRHGHTATLLPDGKVLVAGGTKGPLLALEAEVYDPATGTWSATGVPHSARSLHTATLLLDGRVLVAGDQGNIKTTEVYDPATGTWSITGSLAFPRFRHTATLLPDGKVLVAGDKTAEVYDPAAGTWSTTGGFVSWRSDHAAALLPNGKVLVMGGTNVGVSLATAEVYDPATGTWSATGSLAMARHGHTATLLPDGKVLVAGGQSAPGKEFATAEVYDPATGTWSTTGSLVSARARHTATRLSDGKVLAVGGIRSDGDFWTPD